jgi:hypothetical protein
MPTLALVLQTIDVLDPHFMPSWFRDKLSFRLINSEQGLVFINMERSQSAFGSRSISKESLNLGLEIIEVNPGSLW